MRKWAIGAAVGLLALLANSAFAADLPAPAVAKPASGPVDQATPFQWAGLYFGVNGGYGFGSSKWHNALNSTPNFDISGGVAGGTLGYNWQKEKWVFGVEGDVGWSGIGGSYSPLPCGTTVCIVDMPWLATGRARLGYAFGRWLPYLTAGFAVADIKTTLYGTTESARLGWTAGAGVEWALKSRWSAKLEYLYVGLPGAKCSGACFPANTITVDSGTSLLRAGLNLHF